MRECVCHVQQLLIANSLNDGKSVTGCKYVDKPRNDAVFGCAGLLGLASMSASAINWLFCLYFAFMLFLFLFYSQSSKYGPSSASMLELGPEQRDH